MRFQWNHFAVQNEGKFIDLNANLLHTFFKSPSVVLLNFVSYILCRLKFTSCNVQKTSFFLIVLSSIIAIKYISDMNSHLKEDHKTSTNLSIQNMDCMHKFTKVPTISGIFYPFFLNACLNLCYFN